MLRRLCLLALVVGLPSLASGANDYGQLSMKLKVKTGEGKYERDLVGEELQEFFNYTNCKCAAPFGLELTMPSAGTTNEDIEIWVGSRCDEFEDRNMRCHSIATTLKTSDLLRPKVLEMTARDVFPSTQCAADGDNTIWLLIDENNDDVYEARWSIGVDYDASPPAAVTAVKSAPVEDAIKVSWTPPSSTMDIKYYQLLCASEKDGLPILTKPAADPIYVREEDLDACNEAPPSQDAGVTKLPLTSASFIALDPAYICSGQISNSAQSARIDLSNMENVKQLASDEKIHIKLVHVDKALNIQKIEAPESLPPQPVRDAWEVYHDQGGSADGGFCFVATAVYGDYDHPYVKVLRHFRDETLASFGAGRGFIHWYYEHSPSWAGWLRAHSFWRVVVAVALFPVVAVAWLWNGIGLAGFLLLGALVVAWRRRKRIALFFVNGSVRPYPASSLARVAKSAPLPRSRRRPAGLASGATLALLLSTATPAHAQLILDESVEDETGPPRSRWGFELKLGPYYPDVDGEGGLSGKPYAEMFGDENSLLFQGELDFYFLHPAGQLGVGASAGYMGNSARSFAQTAEGMAGSTRSQDTNSFRVIPTSLSLVYRFTLIADQTVVPLVPYAKVGLAYYIWQFTKGSGDLSDVEGDEARGGTLGFQTSLGLAFRADAIDRGTARALQSELGVEHAGFFFELTYANVSGLGMENRLHLGDFTWAGGVNFEF